MESPGNNDITTTTTSPMNLSLDNMTNEKNNILTKSNYDIENNKNLSLSHNIFFDNAQTVKEFDEEQDTMSQNIIQNKNDENVLNSDVEINSKQNFDSSINENSERERKKSDEIMPNEVKNHINSMQAMDELHEENDSIINNTSLETEKYKTINGNSEHSNDNIPLSYDDDSCSSDSSSNSSQNLIIDQQEPPDKLLINREITDDNSANAKPTNLIIVSKTENTINNLVITTNEDNSLDLTNPLKRKLSFTDTNNEDIDNLRNKIFHYDQEIENTKDSNLTNLQENNNKTDVVSNSLTKLEDNEQVFNENVLNFKEYTENIKNNLDKGGGINKKSKELFHNNNRIFNIENFEQQQYNGDKLVNVKEFEYKCFKCLNANYETLSELREHQKFCVFGGFSPKPNLQKLQLQSDSIPINFGLTNQEFFGKINQRLNATEHQLKNSLISSILQPPLIEPFSILPPPAPARNLAYLVQKELAQIPQLTLQTQQPTPPQLAPTAQPQPAVKQNFEHIRSKQLPTKQTKKSKTQSVAPSTPTAPATTKKKKYFLCSTCGTYHQNWNLFLHMREIHKRHICLYCLGMFPTAEHLTLHLEMKHDLEQIHFDCQEKLLRTLSSRDEYFLMCCTCEHIFTENNEFTEHKCQDYILPCSMCGLNGKHSATCKAGNNNNCKKRKDRTKKNKINENNTKNNLNKQDNTVNNINETIKNIIQLKSTINQNKTNDFNKISNNKQLDYKDSYNVIDENCNNNLKTNGYSENCNFDYDLINLYKSNRIAIMKKEQEQQQQKNLLFDNSMNEPITQSTEHNELHEISNKTNIFNDDYRNFEINTINSNNDNHDTSQKYNNNNNNNLHHNSISILENRLTIKQTPEKLMKTINNNELNENKLIVPKFKLKIPKEYQNKNTTVESEHSSTESDSDVDNENNISMLSSEKCNENNNELEENIGNNCDDNLNKSFNENIKNNDSDMDIDITCNSIELYLPTSESLTATTAENCPPLEQPINDYQILQESEQKDDVTLEVAKTSDNLSNNVLQEISNVPVQSTIEENPTSSIEQNPTSPQPPSSPPMKIDEKPIPSDGIELAEDDIPILELCLNLPIDKIPMVQFLRICLISTYPTCLYCNHARRIAVNGHSLALHILALHRFSATVDSITAEELLPTTIITKLKSFLPDLHSYYFNMNTYCNVNREENIIAVQPGDEKLFECFQCRFATTIHKELYLHNRKMHLRTAILCFMCRSNFYSYSEILCHICPGTPNKVLPFDIKFRCCLCELDEIPSAFRLMVHLRKKHNACDVCLEYCHDQSRLSSHVWKHKLHHLCYRCGIAYRNKPDITKHLFWKHGTESVLCKRCLQKRWPHVYHFCIPPQLFVCDICNLSFSRAMYLKVHRRLHSGDAPYPCTEESCYKKFISRKLLLKHVADHHTPSDIKPNEFDQKTPSRRTSSATNSIKDETIDNTINEKLSIKHETETKSMATNDDYTNDNAEINEKKMNINDLETPTKKKKKKAKHENKETLEDLHLPAPNLSESDSSDESESEKPKTLTKTERNDFVPNVMLSPASGDSDNEKDNDGIDIDKTADGNKILDIWENFKTFQAQKPKIDDDEFDEDKLDAPVPILHVVQSDHDYCRMFRPLTNDKNTNNENTINGIAEETNNADSLNEIKKFVTNKQTTKEKSDSSSSDSSSSTDSSCSCGSNCSCSSSSNSSSDSSSSNDSDSSSSEGKRRIAKKRAAKKEKQRTKNNNSVGATTGATDNNSSENIDVVTNETITTNEINLEPIVLESDLETDESDTDEDFYDEHPQKLASELLAEKRRLLMQQTSLSPSHNFDIVENSRPSTPSLPEEILNREKKQKIKKKKRERKASSKNIIPPFKLNIPQMKLPNNNGKKLKLNKLYTMQQNQPELIYNLTTTINQTSGMLQNNNLMSPGIIDLLPPANLMSSSVTEENIHGNTQLIHTSTPSQISMNNQSFQQQQPAQMSTPYNKQQSTDNNNISSSSYSLVTTPLMSTKHRLSTGSSSDADGSLKRSKRTRRPNRFYGYSSDDDTSQHTISNLIGTGMNSAALFKPTPPPNLTWCKEDLPTPSKSILSNKNYKSSPHNLDNLSGQKNQSHSKRIKIKKENSAKLKKSSVGGTKNLPTTVKSLSSLFPPIPTLKIRPSAILPQVEPSILDHPQTQYYQPQSQQQPPPVVTSDPLIRVPPVPVHHIEPPSCYPSSRESLESTDSSDEEKLTIPVNLYKTPKPKIKTPKSNSKKSSINILPSSNITTPAVAATSSNSVAAEHVSPMSSVRAPTVVPTSTVFKQSIPVALLPNPDLATLQYFKRNNIRYPIRPPAGARAAREGESVYCYCRCPYDEVSEMIACDGDNCMIEWFHFECVGIFVAPQGKWFCAECKPKQSQPQPAADNYQHLSAASASRHYLGY